jgi:phospholipase/carboxylesterase
MISLARRRILLTAFATAGLMGYSNLFGTAAEPGRLQIPKEAPTQTASIGLQKLGGRNGLLYVPPTYHANEPMPLLILLHKATGTASEWFSGGHPSAPDSYARFADAGPFLILAPEASGQTWGSGPKNWGGDFVSINRSLAAALARCNIDRNRVAIGGFSDGGSYALSLGLTNGDLFSNVIAFSPGFIVRAVGRGKPLLFISHGTNDHVLPIDVTSRLFVSGLRKNGYQIVFREFSGDHAVPPIVRDEAMSWLSASFRRRH